MDASIGKRSAAITPRARVRTSAGSIDLGTGLFIGTDFSVKTTAGPLKRPPTRRVGCLEMAAGLDTLEAWVFRSSAHLFTPACFAGRHFSARWFPVASCACRHRPMADRSHVRPARRAGSRSPVDGNDSRAPARLGPRAAATCLGYRAAAHKARGAGRTLSDL